MFEQIKSFIEDYDKIVIHRHKNPDGDAYGSQMGLKRLIELNYPKKTVYAVGDVNIFSYAGEVDEVEDTFYQGALVIVVDVAVSQLISDDRYRLADKVVVIDHHLNDANIEAVSFIDSSYISCAELIAHMAMSLSWKMDASVATKLMLGIVTDSGRFLYPNTSARTFEIAASLMKLGAELQFLYDKLYTESLNFKKLKGYFINNFKMTDHKVAFMKNPMDIKEKFDVSTFTISRAMVNQMSGIENICIWANFTEDDEGKIQCELRSKSIPIVDVARKYGGGGHALACGCTVPSFEVADQILHELDGLVEKSENNG
jgi:phosphoesterase RecJ-like protein